MMTRFCKDDCKKIVLDEHSTTSLQLMDFDIFWLMH